PPLRGDGRRADRRHTRLQRPGGGRRRLPQRSADDRVQGRSRDRRRTGAIVRDSVAPPKVTGLRATAATRTVALPRRAVTAPGGPAGYHALRGGRPFAGLVGHPSLELRASQAHATWAVAAVDLAGNTGAASKPLRLTKVPRSSCNSPIDPLRRPGDRRSSPRITAGCGALEQRHGRCSEDIVGVSRIEGDCAVDLEDVAAAALIGRDVNTGEIDPERSGRAERELARRRRCARVTPDSAESDVGAPFAGQSGALDGTHDPVSGDDDAKIAPGRLDERLDERALATEPAPVLETFEPRTKLVIVAAEIDVAAPAAEARLHHVRRSKPGAGHVADMRRARLRNSGSPEQERRRELVVRRQQRERAVHHLHASPHKPRQLPQTGLDAVERRDDIEPRDRDVAAPQTWRGRGLRQPRAIPEAGKRRPPKPTPLGRFARGGRL